MLAHIPCSVLLAPGMARFLWCVQSAEAAVRFGDERMARAVPNHALELTSPRAGARFAVAQLVRWAKQWRSFYDT